jgi:uncharacterized protein (TIGR02646 family)
MRFYRRRNAPIFTHYSDYREILREDFLNLCAYCTIHEDEGGGVDHFEIDHFKPVSKFKELEHDFKNLYYCCRACNKRGAKGENWPSKALLNSGYRFFDPTKENAYDTHFREKRTGELKMLTNVGVYSLEKLRLNRDALVYLRKRRQEMRRRLRNRLKKLADQLTKVQKLEKQPTEELKQQLQLLRSHLRSRPVLALMPSWLD